MDHTTEKKRLEKAIKYLDRQMRSVWKMGGVSDKLTKEFKETVKRYKELGGKLDA